MSDISWRNERRKVKELLPWDKNPRKISDQQLEQLKRSITKFNYAAPVVIDADGRIVAGHMRTRAMLELGRGDEEVDVRIASRKLTDDEFKELAIRDNANGGDWNLTDLAGFDLEALSDFGMDADLIDRVRQRVKEDGYDAEAEAEKIETPKTQRGDLYILGRHRLLCGDSTKREDYERLMDGAKARLIFTDPPYSVNYKSQGGHSYSKGKFEANAIFNDDKTAEEALTFYVDILKCMHEFSTDDVTLYWWFANKMNWVNRMAWIETGWSMSQIIVWLKETMIFSMGQDYHRCYEPCMLGWKDGNKHYSNKKIADLRDVFMMDKTDFTDLADVWYERRDATNEYVHPTQKPIRLAERALKKNSVTGDIVLDAFGGSGSTMMACEQMDRSARSIELDPKFCDVIVNRWEKFTGKTAEIIRAAV